MLSTFVVQGDLWSVNLGNFATVGLLLVAIVGYSLDRRVERRERIQGQLQYRQAAEEAIRKQERMHTENTERLDQLRVFREFQERLNQRRDDQVNALTTLAATSTEALKGFNRRLEIAEDELKVMRRQKG
jgi:hypothetical protein